MLTFQTMLARTDDPARKKVMLADKTSDMINSVVRQIAFFDFERKVHTARQSQKLSTDDIAAIWLETQKAALGPAFSFHDSYKMMWAYIPHFVHTPMYVYAYAFGDCLVNALYETYEQTGDKDGFKQNYIDLLKKGGAQHYREALAPFGLDPSDPAFWSRGIGMMTKLMDQLEELL